MNALAIARNRHIDAAIRKCFTHLPSSATQKFERKFAEQRSDDDQVMHTFRELIVGAYLASRGEKVEYEMPLAGKTPDWTLMNVVGSRKAILELTNFHAPRREEAAMRVSLMRGEIYCDWQPDPTQRLYQAIQRKVDSYSPLVQGLGLPYLVAVYNDFLAAVEIEELQHVLFEAYEGGIFRYSQVITGVVFFEEGSGVYRFRYFENPTATVPFQVTEGMFQATNEP